MYYNICHIIFITVLASGNCITYSKDGDAAFMSVTSVQSLIKAEKAVVSEMKRMVKQEKLASSETKSKLSRYIERYESMTKTGRTTEQIASHPIDVYHLVKDITMGWVKINQTLQNNHGGFEELFKFHHDNQYPDFSDLPRLATALIRLQECYSLNLDDMVRGDLVDPATDKSYSSIRTLNAWDCILLGNSAKDIYLYGHAVNWVQKAKDLRMAGDKSIPLAKIEQDLKDISIVHDNLLIRRGSRGPGWKTNALPVEPLLAEKFKDRLAFGDTEFRPNLFTHMEYTDLQEQQLKLCRGERLRSMEMDKDLGCRYLTNDHPYLILGPVKLEEKSKDIPIMLFRDFLSDSEIEKIKTLATPYFTDSVVLYRNDSGTLVPYKGTERTAKYSFLAEANVPNFITHLLHRYEAATKLRFKYGWKETLKVLNYSPAGHYVLHNDFRQDPNIPDDQNELLTVDGDHIASLLIYLSDVEAGGATVFPMVGVSVTPEKGTALMWYNLDKAGGADYNSYHAGCPVIYGSKWISSARTFLYDQMFVYNCDKTIWRRHDLL